MYRPRNYVIASGVGSDILQLVAFDKALSASRIADYNLVKVSSILPPNCNEHVAVTEEKGSILFTAYATTSSNDNGIIAAAVGVGIPENSDNIGVIMEYSCFDSKDVAVNQVEEMVRKSMQSRGIRIKEIKTASAEATVTSGIYSVVVAALAMW